jgi:uncharacterized lipoprotein YehR (DUF1307 family)
LSFRLAISLVVAAGAAFGLLACGDSEETQSLSFTLSGDGKSAKLSGSEIRGWRKSP